MIRAASDGDVRSQRTVPRVIAGELEVLERHAARRRDEGGLGKPETFNFLGFTHICGRTRRGTFALQRTTRRDRMQLALRRIKEQLHQIRHYAIPQQGARLRQVVQGYFAYHAVPTNARRLSAFRHHVIKSWCGRCDGAAIRTRSRGHASHV